MARLLPTLLALMLAASFAANSRAMAEDAEDEDGDSGSGGEEEEEDDDEKADTGVSLRAMFPSHRQEGQAQPRFGAGEQVEALIGFDVSVDGQAQHVEFVRAALESVAQPGYVVQNMTGTLYNRTVQRGEAATLVYKFTPDKQIDPRDYGLVIQVWFHEGEDEAERSTLAAFNGTVTLVDASSAVDVQMIVMVLILCGIAAALWKLASKKGGRRARPAPQAREKSVGAAAAAGDSSAGTRAAGLDADFIPKEHLRARNRSSSGGRRSSKK